MNTDLTAQLAATKVAIDGGAQLKDVALLPAIRALDLFRLFDAAVAVGGFNRVSMMERFTPGAYAALIAWAEAQGFEVHRRTITPPGVLPLTCVSVDVPALPGADRPIPRCHISVQAEVVS